MSSKQKNKKQWGGGLIAFDEDWRRKVESILSSPDTASDERPVVNALHGLAISNGSLKDLTTLSNALLKSKWLADACLELVVEILFVDASKPLHRLLLSTFRKLESIDLISSLIVKRIEMEINSYEASGGDVWKNRVVLSAPCSSLLWIPKFQNWIQPCASDMVRVMSRSVDTILTRAGEEEHVSPSTMQEVQDGISCLYYLIQNHGIKMEAESLSLALNSMFRALQGRSLVREAMASAASTLWICLSTSFPSPLATLAQGLFVVEGSGIKIVDNREDREERIRADIVSNIRSFSSAGRTCALKGLSTAIPLPLLCSKLWLLDESKEGKAVPAPFSFLLDGVLSYSCKMVLEESGGDAHLKFHAACVVCSSLQQLALAWRQACDASSDSSPADHPPFLSCDLRDLVCSVVWANMEEPLAQTSRQVMDAFEALLDCLTQMQHKFKADGNLDSDRNGPLSPSFLSTIAKRILDIPHQKKGKYLPLASLIHIIGASGSTGLISMQPDLITKTLEVMTDDMVAGAASQFFGVMLKALRSEVHGDWRAPWLDPLIDSLCLGTDKSRTYVATHALPVVFSLDPEGASALIQAISSRAISSNLIHKGRVGALVSIFRVARATSAGSGSGPSGQASSSLEALISSLASSPEHAADISKILSSAIIHSSESIRIECLELACISPRPSEPPSSLELNLVTTWITNSLRNVSVGQRNKVIAVLSKLIFRIKASAGAILHSARNIPPGALGGRFPNRRQADPAVGASRLAAMEQFSQWLSRALIGGCYPGGPYSRKLLCIEVLNSMLDCWSGRSSQHDASACSAGFQALCPETFTGSSATHTTSLLLAGVVDSWDRLRQGSSQVLLKHPSSLLPGLETPEQLEDLVSWSMDLLWSPRQRESDAAARMLSRVVVDKYLLVPDHQRWRVLLDGGRVRVVAPSQSDGGGGGRGDGDAHPVIEFLSSVLELIKGQIDVVESHNGDLSVAIASGMPSQQQEDSDDVAPSSCRQSFVHGPLLLVRYTLLCLASKGTSGPQGGSDGLGSLSSEWTTRLISLITRVSEICAPALSHPLDGVGAEEVDELDEGGGGEGGGGEEGDDLNEGEGGLGPEAQVKLTACWTSIKEVALVISTIASEFPLPSPASSSPITADQIIGLGDLLLNLLLTLRHNGAVEKTAIGLASLTSRLLVSGSSVADSTLGSAPIGWLNRCLQRLGEQGQTRTDISRRSAGLPFAIGALVLSEPHNTPKRLLPLTMATLLARVGDRDSEPWPTVHAFNTLRHIFNLSELAVDTSVYFAPGFQACLSALGSSWWEVRNAATLCLTALCVRVFGFRNSEMSSSTTGERGRRAITASEFFHRFPPLHDYLLSVLKEAVDQMRLKEAKGLVNHQEQHPGLFPVLIILSRLASQPVTLDPSKHLESDPLSPSSFIPLVQDCGLSSPFMAVRQLAARALSPLISSSCSLETVMRELGEKLINQNVPPRSQQGSAMQLRSILFNLPRDQKATPAVKTLLDTLKSCLARDHATVAPAVSSSIFQATSAALSHVQDTESLAGLLEAVEAACLSVLFDQSQMRGGAGGLGAQADWPLPMKSVMRKHAAALYTGEAMQCSCLLNKRTDLVEKRMRQCLLGSCYEVREAAAENLIQLLGLCNQTRMQPVAVEGDITCRGRLYDLVALISSSGSFNDLILSVEGIVWEALSEDQTSDVKGKLLECLSLLQPLCMHEHQSTDENKELKTISSLLKDARGFDSKAAAIRCYGMAVGREIKRHQASTSQDEKVWLNEASRDLMQEIESSTGADQPEASRAAGRDALASSRLLLLPPARGCMGDTGPVSIRALLTVLKLMEDEDKDTRDLAADAAQEAMSLSQLDSSSTNSSQQDAADGLDSSSSLMTGSLYVEVVIRRTVAFLGSRLSNGGSHALSALQGLVYDPRDPIPELLQENSSVLVRRLFEHEDDNQHEEPLLIAQLVARELRKASSLVQESSVASDWLLSCLETLERVTLVLERQGSLSSRGKWIGGLANHPSIFPYLFRLVLAFWASGAKCHSIQPRLDAALSRLSAIISAPQLRRLLVETQGKLRIQAESEPQSLDDSDDDSALFLYYNYR